MLGSGCGQRLALERERDGALGLERGTDHIAGKAARLAAVRTRLKVEGRGCRESAQANLPILQRASPRRRSPQKREGARRRGSPGDRLHRRERLAGRFDRAVTLPVEIDPDGVKAECHNGILAVFLPRAERDKPKSIQVA